MFLQACRQFKKCTTKRTWKDFAFRKSGSHFDLWSEFYPSLGKPILEAIAFAQGRGWTHRDIKPSNILLSEEGVAKIADYGIAKQLD
jgi:serine/threonine protein kinase